MNLDRFTPIVIAFMISMLAILLIKRSRYGRAVLDHPNHRSLHHNPVPRIGGLGILAGLGAAWGTSGMPLPWVIMLALGLGAISFLDDLYDLCATVRLSIHLAIATVLVCSLMHGTNVYWLVLATLFTAWMINLYNFMDGSDGLAGGVGLIGFGGYAIAAILAHDLELSLMSASIAATCLGFLVFNFPLARIFMGDAGSTALGFLAAALGLVGIVHDVWPIWFPILVFSPFIADATVTLLKRLLQGKKVWEAHREHYYQRLIRSGWSHRKLAISEYILMLVLTTSGLWLIGQPIDIAILALLGWGIVYFILHLMVNKYLK